MYCGDSANTRVSFFVARKTSRSKAKGRPLASRGVALLLGASLAALSGGYAFATTDTWYGNSSVKWSDTGNWVGGAVPTTGQDVVILPGSNAATSDFAPNNLDSSYTLNSLTLGTTTNSPTVTSNYDIETSNSSTLTFQSGGFISDQSGNTGVDKIGVGVSFAGAGSIGVSNVSSLEFGSNVSLGGATTISVASGSSLAFDQGLSGTGPVSISNSAGPGSLIFLGTSNYAGGTTVNTGTLQLGNGTTSGTLTGNVSLQTGTTGLIFNEASGSTTPFAGVISGSGTVTQEGAGSIVTLSGVNTYSGGTNIAAGTLSVANSGNLGTGGISFTNTTPSDATLQITSTGSFSQAVSVGTSGGIVDTDGNVVTFSGGVTGTGSLTLNDGAGTGTLILTGTNTYSGGTTITAGTLQIGSSAVPGSFSATGNVAVAGGATLDIHNVTPNSAFGFEYSGALSGAGNLNVDTGAAITLSGSSNTFTGTTTIATNGVLQIGVAGTASTLNDTGTYSGAISDNGSLNLTNLGVSAVTISGPVTGSGNISIGSPSTTASVILTSASNNFTGTTNITTGSTLQIGAAGFSSSFGGSISNSGTLDFNNIGTSEIFTGSIVGAGAVNLDNGTLILTNSGTTIIGTTTIASGATLQLGNGTTTGTITGDIGGGGDITVDSSSTVTLSGNISGLNEFDQSGTGTTVLSGTESYNGATNVNAGTLEISGATFTGTTAFTVASNATLGFVENTPTPVVFGNSITGQGNLSVAGSGTLVLTASDNYTGTTSITNGTLQIGNGGTAGSISDSSAMTDNGTLAFDRSDNITYGGTVTGSGALTQMGTGTLTITGTNTYSGGTNIAAGTLAVSSHTNLGTGSIAFTNTTVNGATLQFLGNDTFSQQVSLGTVGGTFDTDGNAVKMASEIGGGGSLTLNDSAVTPGTLILIGNETYTGGTTITAGTLQLGDGATGGSLTGDVVNNGTLAFAENADTNFTGAISGTGAVTQNDTGHTLTLSNASNSYTGNTVVTNGAVSISTDSDLGNGGTLVLNAGTTLDTTTTGPFTHAVTVVGDPTFSVSPGTTTTWSGLISDGASAGTVEINGGGTFAPTNASNSYSGGTIVTGASTLVIGADGEIGAALGGVTLGDASSNGILDVNSSFTLGAGRAVKLGAGGGTINTETGVTFEIAQGISGAGGLTVSGPGKFILAGASNYAGGTTVASSGTLQLGDGTVAGTVTGGISLGNGSNLLFAEPAASTVTVSGLISGTGNMAVNSGTVVLTNTNTYTGTTTVTGTLQLGNGTTAGSIANSSSVTDNGAIIFDEPGNTTLGSAISGSGGVTQSGAGTLTLTGANTYTGATTISNGTLQLGSGGLTGSISASSAVADSGTLAFDEPGTFTFASAITGSGNVTQIGAGTTILTGTNTYGGTTTISAGTLQIGNGGTQGSIGGNVTNNAALTFDRSDTVTFSGVISGTGALNQIGTGTLVLTGTNTYSGATTITAGTLQIGSGGTHGSISRNVTDNGALAFDRSDTVTYAGVISGMGTLAQNGTGTLILTGASTLTGATTINSGTLQIGNGGTSGSVAGSISDGSNLAFDRSNSVTIQGAITGAGAVTQIGSGTTILTGTDSYSGGTTVSAGALQLGNGGTTGSITGAVVDNGTFVFDRSKSYTFSGIISGSGGVTQSGPGTTILSAAESYTGPTTVSAGTLLVNGSITGGATSVGTGGTIGGTGSVGKLSINNNGTIAPGSGGLGTLTVNGTFLLGPGATYAAAATSTSADLIKVNGTATLDGALVVTPIGTGFTSTQLEILQTSGGLSGTFTSVTLLGSSTQLVTVTYTADDAFLNFTPSITSLLPASSADTNQSRVGNAVDFALSHDNAIAFNPVTSETGTALTQTLSELSGETAVAFQNVAVFSVANFMDTLFDPSIGGRGGLGAGTDGITDRHALEQVAFNGANSDMPYQHPSFRAVTVWTNFYGGENTTDANTSLGTHRTSATQFGGTVGLDYRSKRGDGAIGIALGMTGNSWDLADQLGKGQSTAYQVGAYYSRSFSNTYLTAGLSYARYSTSTDRTVNLGGANLYHADFVSNSIAARAEAGHTFHTDIGRITPYARFQADDIGVPHYAETTQSGSPSYALSYTGKQHYDYTTEFGTAWNTLLGPVTDLHARVGWLHDYAGGLSDIATFSEFNGASFTVDGASPPRDAAHVVLGLAHNVNNVVFSLNGEAALAGTSTSYGGTASIAVKW